MTTDSTIEQRLTCSIEYPVVFTENVFETTNPALMEAMDRLNENRVHRAMVFVDSHVARAFPRITRQIAAYFDVYSGDIELAEAVRVIPGGEVLKNDVDVLKPLFSALSHAHLCRHSFAIMVGGGALMDVVGFAASLTHRGIRTVRIPTTILAQINAGIGLKTGSNFPWMKDAVGSFAPPFAVLNDWQFLPTLSQKEWVSGIAEAFRISLIADGVFFEELCTMAGCFDPANADSVRQIIRRAASLYLSQMAQQNDPFEAAPEQPLDFGYWAGFKLEMLSNYQVSHGEAVAMGALIDCRYAAEQGWLSEAEFERIYHAFSKLGLPLWFKELEAVGADGNPEVFQGIPDYQERKGGILSITFPNGIGAFREENVIDLEAMERALINLKARGAMTAG